MPGAVLGTVEERVVCADLQCWSGRTGLAARQVSTLGVGDSAVRTREGQARKCFLEEVTPVLPS